MAVVDGGKIRLLRDEAGLSQAELAERADVSQQLVSKFETGLEFDPHLSGVASIARVLGVKVDDLIVHEAGSVPVGA